jgi:hypothetical protein
MSTANIAKSKLVPDSIRIAPYYVNWDEDKNHMAVLYRPGYAVQASELTQMQLILQNQIERFGNHIFKNGSKILGGSISIDKSAKHINLQTQYAGTDIVASSYVANTITHSSGNTYVQAYVIGSAEATANDSPVIVVKYITGNEFENSTTIKTNSNVYANIATTNSSGYCTAISISEGIFYVNGYFVKVPEQTLVVDKFSTQANARIGLEYSNDIIDSSQDTDLLDPAQEASNYQAPGANRLQINFDLAYRSLTSEDDDNFVEFMRIENGILKSEIVYPQYSALGDTLARRTYDESGNYTVRPFLLNVFEHPTDDASLDFRIDPGKAYINGYETETISQQSITVPRARANSSLVNNYDIPMNYGNYIIVGDLKANLDMASGSIADIHCVPYQFANTTSNTGYTSTKIGTGHIKYISFEGGSNTTNANTRTYRVGLFDTAFANLTSNVSAATANGFLIYDPTFKFSANANAYNGATLRIIPSTGGAAVAETLVISAYGGNAAFKTINTATSFVNTPNNAFQFSIDYDFKMAESLIVNGFSAGAPTRGLTVNLTTDSKSANALIGLANGDAYLKESTLTSLVFPFPQSFIKAGSITDQSFQYIKKIAVTFTGGTTTATLATYPAETFNGGGGTGTSSAALSNFIVIDDTTGRVIEMSTIGITLGVATFTAKDSSQAGAATVYAVINLNSGQNVLAKSKTLTTGNTSHLVLSSSNGSFVTGSTNTTVYLVPGQAVIQTPSRVPDTDMSLYVSDVKSVTKIYDLAGAAIPAAGSSLSGYTDVTSKYSIDNGQRDTHYDHASIRLKSRVTAPQGPLIVCFDWYDHLAGGTSDGLGYFSVDSYPNVANTAGYAAIPTFTKSDGTVLQLRDTIDFRPKRQNASNTSPNYTVQGLRIPVPNQNFSADYQYYLGRRDYLVISPNQSNPFNLIQGEPGLYPQWPRLQNDSMVLYKIYLEPYTLGTANARLEFVENKRYTMTDIGTLEDRIENLEYYNTLTLLEKSVTDLSITDSDGLERSKYGVLVDNFSTYGSGDIDNPDYSVAIDKIYGAILPRQVTTESKLYVANETNTSSLGEISTLSYTKEACVSQLYATKWVNVQPYLFADFIGTVYMDPPADNWIDTIQAPDVIINSGAVNADLLANNSTNSNRSNTRNNAFTTTHNAHLVHFGTRKV